MSKTTSYNEPEASLLGLPLELREKIYKNLFKLEKGTGDSNAIALKTNIGPGHYGEAKSCEALGLWRPDRTYYAKDDEHHGCVADFLSMGIVCKRFYVEVKQKALMWKWNTFLLYSNAPDVISSLAPARDRDAVESVHWIFHPSSTPVSGNTKTGKYHYDAKWISEALRPLAKIPNLKHLVLEFSFKDIYFYEIENDSRLYELRETYYTLSPCGPDEGLSVQIMGFIRHQEIYSQIGARLETFSLRLNVMSKVKEKRICLHDGYDWNCKNCNPDLDRYGHFSPDSWRLVRPLFPAVRISLGTYEDCWEYKMTWSGSGNIEDCDKMYGKDKTKAIMRGLRYDTRYKALEDELKKVLP